MQNLGTEVGQLGSLFELQVTNRFRILHESGAIVVHAVYVGPDLYLLGIDSSTYQRSRIITATALQVVNLAVGIAADIALSDIDFGIGVLLQQCRKFGFDKLVE